MYIVNQEHIKLIKKSQDEWNEWRQNNPSIIPCLKGAYFREADLSGRDLRKVDLRWADLRNADLHIANLSESKLSGAEKSGKG
jgi:uncharacterized protein YjbI with pentapeptide repeats